MVYNMINKICEVTEFLLQVIQEGSRNLCNGKCYNFIVSSRKSQTLRCRWEKCTIVIIFSPIASENTDTERSIASLQLVHPQSFRQVTDLLQSMNYFLSN